MTRVLLLLVVLSGIALSMPAWSDIPGARDPVSFPRYARAEIISFSADTEPREYEFIVSHVEKIRRELKVDDQVRVEAKEIRAIYEIPAGTPLESVIAHYRSLIPVDDVEFSCRGRDCGRSAQWANQVFGQASLYGPDAGQFYLAGKRPEGLVSLYIIRLLATDQDVAVRSGLRMVEMLGSNGHVIVNGVLPNVDGSLPARAVGVLASIQPHLDRLREEQVYVVCHLYAPGAVNTIIARSQKCAEQAVALLKTTPETSLVPFGAGPLLPRDDRSSRLELVLPHRRHRD
jgi:Domain of unknown function (DUF4892)